MKAIQQDTIGYAFRFTIKIGDSPLDLTGKDELAVVFRMPSGLELMREAEMVGNATDGTIEYHTVAGDLSEFGYWEVQGRAHFGDGRLFPSEVERILVNPNLTPPPIVIGCEPVELEARAPLHTLATS